MICLIETHRAFFVASTPIGISIMITFASSLNEGLSQPENDNHDEIYQDTQSEVSLHTKCELLSWEMITYV